MTAWGYKIQLNQKNEIEILTRNEWTEDIGQTLDDVQVRLN